MDWPNLRRIVLHRSVRENLLPKEVQYFVTENKNNVEFLNGFKYRNKIEHIAVTGNYFSSLMGNSLFMQQFTALK